MSRRPLVSIVTPAYDRTSFLIPAVESVLAQTFRDWELIIVDDGSSDVSALQYLRSLRRDSRVRVLWREHVGNPGCVRNAGIADARADLVAFMDSDDLWTPAKLETQLAEMRLRSACRWSYTGFLIVDAEDVPFPSEAQPRFVPYDGEIFAEVVRGAASIRTPAVVVDTRLLRQVGGFDESIACAEDVDLWARLALAGPVCVVAAALVRVRRHRPDSAGIPGASHAGRERSLRKLAAELSGPRRGLLVEELGRNAWRHAQVMAELAGRGEALATFAAGMRFGWRYPRWWRGLAKAAARTAVGRGTSAAAVTGRTSRDTVEAGLERAGEEQRAGGR